MWNVYVGKWHTPKLEMNNSLGASQLYAPCVVYTMSVDCIFVLCLLAVRSEKWAKARRKTETNAVWLIHCFLLHLIHFDWRIVDYVCLDSARFNFQLQNARAAFSILCCTRRFWVASSRWKWFDFGFVSTELLPLLFGMVISCNANGISVAEVYILPGSSIDYHDYATTNAMAFSRLCGISSALLIQWLSTSICSNIEMRFFVLSSANVKFKRKHMHTHTQKSH